MQQWSHAPLLRGNHHEKQQNTASPNLWRSRENWWVPPMKITFFFCYQTLRYMVASEPHPQPHYQTACKYKSQAIKVVIKATQQ